MQSAGEVDWYIFSLAGNASGGRILQIDTIGSAVNAELGLYDANGNLIADDDDDGGGGQALLDFGDIGSDGTLPSGDHYLAIAGFDTTFNATGFDVVSLSVDTGDYSLTFTTNFGQAQGACCTSGVCIVASNEVCTDSGGTYLGDHTVCDTDGDDDDDACGFCGNGLADPGEQCDGTDDAKCPGSCLPDCTCEPGTKIPTVSEWSLIVMALLLATAGTVVLGRRRRPAAA